MEKLINILFALCSYRYVCLYQKRGLHFIKKTLLLLFLKSCFTLSADAQSFPQIHLSRNNGLPGNHAYAFQTDQYGYLWIATSKGVVRYNGYECKTFNTSDGLPVDDVWQMYLDRKQRLWLFTISNKLGYMHNGKYHAARTHNDLLYPGKIIENDTQLLIFNRIPLSGSPAHHKYHGSELLFRDKYSLGTPGGDAPARDFDVSYTSSDLVEFMSFANGQFVKNGSCLFDKPVTSWLAASHIVQYQNYLFYFNHRGDRVGLVHPRTCRFIPFFQNTPHKHFAYLNTSHHNDGEVGEFLYIFYNEQIDKLDSTLKVLQTWSVSALTGNKAGGSDLVYFFEDSLWGICVASQTQGVFINKEDRRYFKTITDGPNARLFLGAINDSTGYWWYAEEDKIATSGGGLGFTAGRSLPKKILRYKDHVSILLAAKTYLLDHDKGITRLLTPKALKTAVVTGTGLYGITSGDVLYYHLSDATTADRKLFNGRFNDILYDSVTKNVCVYNNYNITIYSPAADSYISVKGDILKALGLKTVDKILIDKKYGNIFIKDNDRLLTYDTRSFRFEHLLRNVNLSGAKLLIVHDSMLVVAGKPGVAFIKIYGPARFSEPLIYYNDYGQYFSEVTDLQALGMEALLTTDRGILSVTIPSEITTPTPQQPYNIVVRYGDEIATVDPGDTLTLPQNHNHVQFDIVRPSGNGHPKYRYFISGVTTGWINADAGDVEVSMLEAGTNYTLRIKIQDDVWISDPVTVVIYRTPDWWQTTTGKSILTLLAVSGALVVIGITIFATRKIILRNTRKRNELLELKLKSVHAQINPHFIYNTLNSALLLISNNKMTEAYKHVSRFSRLLRAYVKSSRNKYISIQDEVVNLKNYIELQQTRFKDKFSYNISIDEAIPPESSLIPSLLLQPFVENAISHGLLNKHGKGHLEISFKRNSFNYLTCIIEDDGIGRLAANALEKDELSKESYGNELIDDLISVFRKYEDMQIEIKYHDKAHPLSGTIVVITIKK